MPIRDAPSNGAPCWADLWTSDVDGARRFYGELFGWESSDPQPEFGGYFVFSRDGVQVAGAMGDMGEMKANNRWKVYFATDDADVALERASKEGAQVVAGPMAVADLGVQAVLVDPTGVDFGTWQPGTFNGYTVLGAPRRARRTARPGTAARGAKAGLEGFEQVDHRRAFGLQGLDGDRRAGTLFLDEVFEAFAVRVVVLRWVPRGGHRVDEHRGHLELPGGSFGLDRQRIDLVEGVPDLVGVEQGLDHEDVGTWPDGGEVLLLAKDEGGDRHLVRAEHRLPQQPVGALSA